MIGYIDGYNFKEMGGMRYWAPPASWDLEKKKEKTRSRIFSGEWWGAEKKDGYFTKIIKDEDGNIFMQSRSRNVKGEFPEKHEWVPHLQSFFDELPNGTCLLGELYLPSKPGSSNITTLLGCLKEKCITRQEKGEKLHLYIFDILALEGKSYMKMPLKERMNEINFLERTYPYEFVSYAKFFNGKELWENLQRILAEGGEGMVILYQDSLYEPDKRPSKTTQKVKKELQDNLDVVIIGANKPTRLYNGKEIENWKYWEDTKTFKRLNGDFFKEYANGAAIEPVTKMYFMNGAGSLKIGVYKDGKIVQVGSLSGLDDEVLFNWQDYVGKVAEITAMQIMETGGLRHSKFQKWREDKSQKDCTWESFYGN